MGLQECFVYMTDRNGKSEEVADKIIELYGNESEKYEYYFVCASK